ncbi:MAG: hypothetical protein AAF471_09640, partial [Myxococcota bacterium]
ARLVGLAKKGNTLKKRAFRGAVPAYLFEPSDHGSGRQPSALKRLVKSLDYSRLVVFDLSYFRLS